MINCCHTLLKIVGLRIKYTNFMKEDLQFEALILLYDDPAGMSESQLKRNGDGAMQVSRMVDH